MLKKFCITAVCALVIASCAQSPTGRRQVMLFDNNQLNQMGAQTFEGMKEETPTTKDQKTTKYVQCVADALLKVTPEKYVGTDWEVVVFESEQVNAFALPGGKIGVYTGLLKVAENQNQLAAVMGHEIAHVIAGHGNERLSTNQLLSTGLAIGGAALGAYNVQYQNEIMAALGVGAQVGVALPFSRTHETEADLIGLDLMAQAGFNPEQAVNLWQNMAAQGSGGTPEFLSSHPIPANRIKALQDKMPQAKQLFTARMNQGALPNCKR